MKYITLMRLFNDTNTWTKLRMVSEMARLFDPLGLIGPVVVQAKILVVELWCEKIGWDTKLPDIHHKKWEGYYNHLIYVKEIRINRRVLQVSEPTDLQLHIFCDASEAAYGACVYIKSKGRDNVISCELLCSRSRVALLKVTAIPRLELCAALLALRLSNKITAAVPLTFSKRVIWSDSTIALAWIKNHQGINDNPADHANRGLN
ncbi:unnamed protein product [Macrosiphum euphorbiae]|uniref:RNase H type-1 domain-containing protein n=1 Tax=Macrosiphum euphorbiae TaxID=13131 RepID=A0AAV0VQG9_9HEMI|nr:unnamed protein product [Macrosiphum euphorbiae]